MLIGGRAHTLKEIRSLGKAGVDFAEINLQHFTPRPSFHEVHPLLQLKKEFGFFFMVHGPEEGNPFDCQEIRSTLLPKIKLVCDFACAVGAKLITLHFWLDQRFIEKSIVNGKLDILEEIVTLAVKKNPV